ncbi:hypothetical protein [Streptomyces olivochromogenes]|uniref:hypothetical protein n=1 Tax=Streptomyces olivochromogenes TaxID=1963 RepID=UPI001F3A9C75|nr:hypothetical protein [Streptomyces olivochromogenes]MCF3134631.1 hypothetical protein [Streptomyces olivochromogenes]
MPADEVTHGTDVDESRVRTGPRHAAPKKPLFTRFHMPAGKAIASVAMPTAVLMGMGFTSTLALADNGTTPPSSKSLTADEYKDCVTALDGAKDASASPSPSASASESTPEATPTPTATATAQDSTSGKTSSSDSGSGDKATPTPTATSGSSDSGAGSGSDAAGSGGGAAATPAPSASQSSGGNLLDTIGDTIGDILTGGSKDSGSTPSASPTPSATSTSDSPAPASSSSSDGKGTATDTVKDTVDQTTKTATDTVKDTTDAATEAATDTTKAVQDATGAATPTPSASSSTSADNCPVATDDESGVDNKVPVADDPWYLNASSLLLKGADYQGIVEVKTADGTKKKVLKYVISGGTDIGDLHQTVNDKQSGKTYHVQAAKGSTSTIRNGDTVMYTQSISGNLFGLIPVTFSPDSPPPLNIPLIYFTNVKVTQAAQFGGSLHVPGMHVYTTD